MADRNTHDVPRRFSRIAFHRPAVLDLEGVRAGCEVLEVSLKGALVEVSPSVRARVGDECTLTIRLDAGDATIRMEAEVAHVTGTRVGVRCQEIDLASIEHLRQVVASSLGDEALLERELGELVARREG
jgi:hypothetical protein